MKTPYIVKDRFILKIADESNAAMLSQYYKNNKKHLIPWEPKRQTQFYTKNFWLDQVNQAQKLFEQRQAVKLIALDTDESQLIGTCNFNNIVFGCFYACHLGFSIDKDSEGKGLMFEIIQSGILYMQNEFKLHRIMANHMKNNVRSNNLLRRLGFEKEGYAKSYLKINGKWQDHILNSLILPSD
ncbi:MAG: ribosomal protein S5-alanine N-acetyltransferase [Marinicellaceae bacterium]